MPRKSLACNVDIERTLQSWSKGPPLVRANHFFWILGEHVQKSIEGLLRNLLYSILSTLSRRDAPQCYHVVKEVCGLRWASMDSRSSWGRKDLKSLLLHLTSMAKMSCFFMIDALDECEPQGALGELADEVLWMSRLPNVKLCVSCRPWTVFVQKFESASCLRIDLLTYRDMAKYIRSRLLSTEAECDSQIAPFHANTQLAKDLINATTDAAQGVFLWVELVTKELCSELRKGAGVKQLREIVHDFPADLDQYFQTLIFDRIGRTRRNIRDTAAALKLAMEIHRNNKLGVLGLPYSMSFMNFWLLRQGNLQRGFSWNDYESVKQFPVGRMMKELTSFLEETCKDLLIPTKKSSRHSEWEIQFLHRTVYDFLSDSSINTRLERDAPEHFSDPGFVAELARLRCLCLLSQRPSDCHLVRDVFYGILEYQPASTSGDCLSRWIATCESFTITQMQANCLCLGLDHLSLDHMAQFCVRAGLIRYPREAMKKFPHLALKSQMHGLSQGDILAGCLGSSMSDEFQIAYISSLDILQESLECGCDPNSLIIRNIDDCRRTCWQSWLAGMYHLLQQLDRSINPQMVQRHKRAIGAIISLLLEYGADPRCMICLGDHDGVFHARTNSSSCRWVTLRDLLHLLVLPEPLANIVDLLAKCSDEVTISKLRRNQYRRSMRSLMISEQNLARRVEDEGYHATRSIFLEELLEKEHREFILALTADETSRYEAKCLSCSGEDTKKCLFTWCIDCRGISYCCRDCETLPVVDEVEPPCGFYSGHVSIIVAHDAMSHKKEERDGDLALRYSVAKAITVLKGWYAKNPI